MTRQSQRDTGGKGGSKRSKTLTHSDPSAVVLWVLQSAHSPVHSGHVCHRPSASQWVLGMPWVSLGDKFRFRHLLSRAARRCSSSAGCNQVSRCAAGTFAANSGVFGAVIEPMESVVEGSEETRRAISGETGGKPHLITSFTSPCFSFIQNLSGFLKEAICGPFPSPLPPPQPAFSPTSSLCLCYRRDVVSNKTNSSSSC